MMAVFITASFPLGCFFFGCIGCIIASDGSYLQLQEGKTCWCSVKEDTPGISSVEYQHYFFAFTLDVKDNSPWRLQELLWITFCSWWGLIPCVSFCSTYSFSAWSNGNSFPPRSNLTLFSNLSSNPASASRIFKLSFRKTEALQNWYLTVI